MIQILAGVLSLVIIVAAMTIGIGSTTPGALARQQVETEGVVGYGAFRSAADAYAVANRGATLGDDAMVDLGPYVPLRPRLPEGLAWTVRGGASPYACASGPAPSHQEVEALRRLESRLGGTLGLACGTAGEVADGGPAALTLPLATN